MRYALLCGLLALTLLTGCAKMRQGLADIQGIQAQDPCQVFTCPPPRVEKVQP